MPINNNLECGISAVFLAYNEAENLRIILPKVRTILNNIGENYEILVIDSERATDDTELVCLENNARYIPQEYPGFGGAFKTGIHYARYDKYLTSDSDGSMNPEYIANIYSLFNSGNYDLVIGSRYTKGGKTNDTLIHTLMSLIIRIVFRIVLGLKATDTNINFRMHKTVQLKEIEHFNPLVTCNFSVQQEIFLKLKLAKKEQSEKLSIGETPITFEERIAGKSKRRLLEFIIEYARNIFFLSFLRFPALKNLLLYVAFGSIAAVADYFTTLFAAKSLPVEYASLCGNAFGFLITFTTNTFFNFKKRTLLGIRFISYLSIVIVGAAISTFLLYMLKDIITLKILKAILIIIISALQFILNKTITYGLIEKDNRQVKK